MSVWLNLFCEKKNFLRKSRRKLLNLESENIASSNISFNYKNFKDNFFVFGWRKIRALHVQKMFYNFLVSRAAVSDGSFSP
jgi:hypothetical protein